MWKLLNISPPINDKKKKKRNSVARGMKSLAEMDLVKLSCNWLLYRYLEVKCIETKLAVVHSIYVDNILVEYMYIHFIWYSLLTRNMSTKALIINYYDISAVRDLYSYTSFMRDGSFYISSSIIYLQIKTAKMKYKAKTLLTYR